MARAFGRALELAGIGVDEVSCFDFYSCFPSAVGLALDTLKIRDDDPRGVTLTGGLPYAGGPGNNYVTHSLAAAVERLRGDRGKLAMVTGLGWYFTKHAAAILSSGRPRNPFARDDGHFTPGPLPVRLIEQAQGPAVIETYTVVHDRNGVPAEGIVVGRLDDGARFFARTPRELLPAMEAEEFIGRRGAVRVLDGLNLFEPR
jgi:acetyl-CoA C-acetyltransferase